MDHRSYDTVEDKQLQIQNIVIHPQNYQHLYYYAINNLYIGKYIFMLVFHY
jgi:hypothetical protein